MRATPIRHKTVNIFIMTAKQFKTRFLKLSKKDQSKNLIRLQYDLGNGKRFYNEKGDDSTGLIKDMLDELSI